MFGAGGIAGSSADSRHQQHHEAGAFPATSVSPAGSPAVVHALAPAGMPPDQQHAGYYGQQHGGYQQWLPAQFAQFQLGGYPGGTTFYGPPAGMQGMPGMGMPAGLGAHGGADPGQPYLPGPPFGMAPGGLHHDAAPPRGWGGIQLQQQLDRRGGGAYGHRGARGAPHNRGGGSRGGARGGRGQRGRGGPGDGGAEGLQEVLLCIKRLPPEAPIDDGVLQLLRGMDSRGLAALIKELGRGGLAGRAAQLFDRLRALGPASALAPLLDEFSFTALISNCVGQQDLARAMALAEEMRDRGIERNVHTFSALMNVCIKCGQYKLALEVYRDMQAAGCPPNVVTYNTLIDVYGKSGQWEEALDVLAEMDRQRVPPVTRTYNTLMIACNTSNQWEESLRLHDEMTRLGLQPNTTTFNALISAHSKSGDLSKVLKVFKEMVQKGCERSVITYSTLISACEKAGEWELALQLFEEMRGEGCVPNVISYNSLITACAQGAQWEKAAEVFEAMQRQGCRPDVVTYTALISAYEKGGQWRRALAAFEEMRRRPCPPDAIVYAAIIDALWDTGLSWAQRRAVALYKQAAQEGLNRSHSDECGGSWELNLHSTTAGVALLSLHCWLHELHAKLEGGGPGAMPHRLTIVVGRGKAREAGQSVAKDCVTALLRSLRAPFRDSPDSTPAIGRLEASGQQAADWLAADADAVLAAVIPPAGEGLEAGGPSGHAAEAAKGGEAAAAVGLQDDDAQGGEAEIARAAAGSAAAAAPPAQLQPQAHQAGAAAAPPAGRDAAVAAAEAAAAVAVAGLGRGAAARPDPELEAELATEARVVEAFATVKFFEETHCLSLQAMGPAYTQQRADLVALARTLGARLGLPEETVHDAVLLLDRAMSAPVQVAEGLLGVAVAACLAAAAEQAPPPRAPAPTLAEVSNATGVLPELLTQVHASLVAALAQDTAAISALRCLRLFLERLGGLHTPAQGWQVRGPFRLLHETLADPEFLNYRPSVVAAAVLFVDRRSRGLAPYWPSALAQLTGYAAQATPELAAAVAGAQRLHDRLQVPAALLGFQPAAAAARGGDGGSAAAGSAPPTPGNGAPPAAPSAGGSAAGLSRVPSAAAVPLYAPASTAGALHPAALAAAVAQLLPGSPGVADAAVLPEPPPAL